MYAQQAKALTDKIIQSDKRRPEIGLTEIIAKIKQAATDDINPSYNLKVSEYIAAHTLEELRRLKYIVTQKGRSTLITWG